MHCLTGQGGALQEMMPFKSMFIYSILIYQLFCLMLKLCTSLLKHSHPSDFHEITFCRQLQKMKANACVGDSSKSVE